MTKFWLVFITVAFGLLVVIISINVVVDPYRALGTNWVGSYHRAERPSKMTMVKHYPHDALMIGNSRTAYINAGPLCGKIFFNASFSAAKLDEIFTFIEKYHTTESPVIVGVDFRMFDKVFLAGPENDFNEPWLIKVLNNTLGMVALKGSFESIKGYLNKAPQLLLANGSRNPAAKNLAVAAKDSRARKKELEHALKYTRNQMSGFKYEPENIKILRRVHDLLLSKRSEMIIVLFPVHPRKLENYKADGHWASFVRWKADLKKSFSKVYDYTDAKIYAHQDNFYPIDPTHFYPKVGRRIISKVLADNMSRSCPPE